MSKDTELYLRMDESDRPFEKDEKTRLFTKEDKDFENKLLTKYGIPITAKPSNGNERK